MAKNSSRTPSPVTGAGHNKAIIRLLSDAARRHHVSQIWSDWLEVCAIALAAADLRRAPAREQRYREIMKRYGETEHTAFARAFAHLQMAYQERFHESEDGTLRIDFDDILGGLYMAQDLGNAAAGQFFTPYDVSRLMAKMQTEGIAEQVQARGYVTVMEPACGAGGMIIAVAEALHEAGCNYQRSMHATAIDVDARCVHMTFIQMALLHIPGIVVHGNTLTMKAWDQWATPAHVLGGWSWRLRRRGDDAPITESAPTAQSTSPGSALLAGLLETSSFETPFDTVDDQEDVEDDQSDTGRHPVAEVAR